ncbi:transcriptional regulator [Acidithiobacillus caldus]|uniref:Transcriptional regulator n=1 Tax=Acidithiobacillus caldus TaxID=33059 RepID=A0A1E7YTC8_9PROT|nr:transcriptional regulator [Acidithiobacillus caldus]
MEPSPSQKMQSLILRSLAQKGQRKAAEAIGVHESALSRFVAGDGGLKFEQICDLFSYLDIHPEYLGDGEKTTIKAENLRALRILARAAMEEGVSL